MAAHRASGGSREAKSGLGGATTPPNPRKEKRRGLMDKAAGFKTEGSASFK